MRTDEELAILMKKYGIESWHPVKPPIFEHYNFERVIDLDRFRIWGIENRGNAFILISFYILSVVFGQKWMKNRPAYNLRRPLIFWNIFLSFICIFGAMRSLPELFYLMKTTGFYRTVCIRENLGEPLMFWYAALGITKFIQLGDTAFLVLRKKKVETLHVLHHSVTAYLGFLLGPEAEPFGRIFVTNYVVQAPLYAFQAMQAMGFKVNRKLPIYFTAIEICQFVIGIPLQLYTVGLKLSGTPCARTNLAVSIMTMGGFIYLAYFIYYIYAKNSKLKEKKS